MTVTGDQICEARKLLGWSSDALAGRAHMSASVVLRVEANRTGMSQQKRDAIISALELAGVEFIAESNGGPGVRLRKMASTQAIPIDKLDASNDK